MAIGKYSMFLLYTALGKDENREEELSPSMSLFREEACIFTLVVCFPHFIYIL